MTLEVPLARNIAEVIDDLYRQHAPLRNHERMIELVQHRIEHTMQQLQDRYRLAIELRLVQELSREECAQRLGVTIGTFDVLLFRAIRAFRKHFGTGEP